MCFLWWHVFRAVNVDESGKYLGKCPIVRSGSVPSRKPDKSSTNFSSELTTTAFESSAPIEASGGASGTASESDSEKSGSTGGGLETGRPLVLRPLEASRTFRDRSATSPSLYTHSSSTLVVVHSSNCTLKCPSNTSGTHSSIVAKPALSVHLATIGGATIAPSQADPTSQKVRRVIHPRDLQEATRALVTHVLRVESSEASPHALHVSTIMSCGPYVRLPKSLLLALTSELQAKSPQILSPDCIIAE